MAKIIFLDDRHFGYITKSFKNKKNKNPRLGVLRNIKNDILKNIKNSSMRGKLNGQTIAHCEGD
jgi:hypothetical protein